VSALAATGVLLLNLLTSGSARANPRPLAFTYPSESLAKDALELEEFVDLTPVRAYDPAGDLTWIPRAVLTTELEIGLTDRLELGLYLQLDDDPGGSSGQTALRFGGVKQRLRWRLADPGAWPVDVALYGEVAEMFNELELEAKIILQRRFGPLRLMVNLWGEREFYYSGEREWVINPTGGITAQLTPSWHLGIESWMRAEYSDRSSAGEAAAFNRGPVVYLGPDVMWQRGRTWVTLAPYVRLDHGDRASVRGDLYGRFFVRLVVGIE
jgi:hypothetical protein